MSHDPAITFDALRARDQAESLLLRLEAALEESAAHPAHQRERRWIEESLEIVRESCAALDPLLAASERLPEREAERPAFARLPQDTWVDALERLYAGIAYHLGPRAPVLEALFPHAKFAMLRKPKQELVRTYWETFSKRRLGSYVQRILAEPEATFVAPLMTQAEAALAAWETALTGPSLDSDEATTLRDRLLRATDRVGRAHRQAKHLLEAATLGLPELSLAAPVPGSKPGAARSEPKGDGKPIAVDPILASAMGGQLGVIDEANANLSTQPGV